MVISILNRRRHIVFEPSNMTNCDTARGRDRGIDLGAAGAWGDRGSRRDGLRMRVRGEVEGWTPFPFLLNILFNMAPFICEYVLSSQPSGGAFLLYISYEEHLFPLVSDTGTLVSNQSVSSSVQLTYLFSLSDKHHLTASECVCSILRSPPHFKCTHLQNGGL
jgi:hypothetical protein